jgi:nucleotide-binding universal stress UspA family protein
MFKTILIPLDGSKLAEAVIPMARALALANQAHIVLFQNVEPLYTKTTSIDALAAFDMAGVERAMHADAQNYLEQTAGHLRERGLNVTVNVASETSTADAIVGVAKRHGVDLIAMATNGRSGLGRILLGSVADRVLRISTTPVLLERPDQSKAH